MKIYLQCEVFSTPFGVLACILRAIRSTECFFSFRFQYLMGATPIAQLFPIS